MKRKARLKAELESVKDMAVDLAPRFSALLNPAVYLDPEGVLTAVGTILSSFAGDRISKLLKEITETESLDSSVLNADEATQKLIELTKFVAYKNPDPETWEAAKKIFIKALNKNITNQEKLSFYEHLNICQNLCGTEIRILAGAYDILLDLQEKKYSGEHNNVERWRKEISLNIGLETSEEIARYEDNLTRQMLISPAESLRGDILSTWRITGNDRSHRLTALGRRFAEAPHS